MSKKTDIEAMRKEIEKLGGRISDYGYFSTRQCEVGKPPPASDAVKLYINLSQVKGGIMMALARKIAEKKGVSFNESCNVDPGEDSSNIHMSVFYVDCFSAKEVRERGKVLIRAEDTLNAKCEKFADFIMKL